MRNVSAPFSRSRLSSTALPGALLVTALGLCGIARAGVVVESYEFIGACTEDCTGLAYGFVNAIPRDTAPTRKSRKTKTPLRKHQKVTHDPKALAKLRADAVSLQQALADPDTDSNRSSTDKALLGLKRRSNRKHADDVLQALERYDFHSFGYESDFLGSVRVASDQFVAWYGDGLPTVERPVDFALLWTQSTSLLGNKAFEKKKVLSKKRARSREQVRFEKELLVLRKRIADLQNKIDAASDSDQARLLEKELVATRKRASNIEALVAKLQKQTEQNKREAAIHARWQQAVALLAANTPDKKSKVVKKSKTVKKSAQFEYAFLLDVHGLWTINEVTRDKSNAVVTLTHLDAGNAGTLAEGAAVASTPSTAMLGFGLIVPLLLRAKRMPMRRRTRGWPR